MTIKICIIGFGSAGKQHELALRGINDIEVHSILDLSMGIDTGNYVRKNSWEEVLQDPHIDAIALCIPPGGRVKLALEAIRAGKSVMLEKPPSTSIEELDLLLKAADEMKQTVGVMFQHRYRIPRELYSQEWGEKTVATLEISRPREINRYFKGWRTDAQQSFGGIATHLGVHYLDIACLLLGEPTSVYQTDRKELTNGIDLRSVGTVHFESGAVMSFIITGEALERSERLKIFSEDRTLIIEDGEITITQQGQSLKHSSRDVLSLREELYHDFKEAILERRQPVICNIESAKKVTKILSALFNEGKL